MAEQLISSPGSCELALRKPRCIHSELILYPLIIIIKWLSSVQILVSFREFNIVWKFCVVFSMHALFIAVNFT